MMLAAWVQVYLFSWSLPAGEIVNLDIELHYYCIAMEACWL